MNCTNWEIKSISNVVNLVDSEGKGLKQMSLEDAIELAESTGEDVVLLSNKDDIPVVKIADYSKMLYEQHKKEKENKRKAKLNAQENKEIQISDSIAEHDLVIKAKNVDRLLSENHKVTLVIRYKGRTVRMIDRGPSKLRKLAELVSEQFKVDKVPTIEGNRVSMVLAPIKK